MKLKDKAKAKAERRAARRAEPSSGHGPPIATDEGSGATTPTTDAQPTDAPAPAAPPAPGRPR